MIDACAFYLWSKFIVLFTANNNYQNYAIKFNESTMKKMAIKIENIQWINLAVYALKIDQLSEMIGKRRFRAMGRGSSPVEHGGSRCCRCYDGACHSRWFCIRRPFRFVDFTFHRRRLSSHISCHRYLQRTFDLFLIIGLRKSLQKTHELITKSLN